MLLLVLRAFPGSFPFVLFQLFPRRWLALIGSAFPWVERLFFVPQRFRGVLGCCFLFCVLFPFRLSFCAFYGVFPHPVGSRCWVRPVGCGVPVFCTPALSPVVWSRCLLFYALFPLRFVSCVCGFFPPQLARAGWFRGSACSAPVLCPAFPPFVLVASHTVGSRCLVPGVSVWRACSVPYGFRVLFWLRFLVSALFKSSFSFSAYLGPPVRRPGGCDLLGPSGSSFVCPGVPPSTVLGRLVSLPGEVSFGTPRTIRSSVRGHIPSANLGQLVGLPGGGALQRTPGSSLVCPGA